MPLAVEVDGLRVVHACWDDASLDALESYLADDGGFSPNLIHAAADKGSESWQAIEHLLKGPEVPLPRPYEFPTGVPRHEARLQWWRPEATRLDEAVWIPGGATEPDGSPYVLTDDSPFVSPVGSPGYIAAVGPVAIAYELPGRIGETFRDSCQPSG